MAPDCGDMLAAGNYSKHAHSQHSQYSQHSQQIPPGEHSGQLAGDMQSANGNGAGDSGSMHGHPYASPLAFKRTVYVMSCYMM